MTPGFISVKKKKKHPAKAIQLRVGIRLEILLVNQRGV